MYIFISAFVGFFIELPLMHGVEHTKFSIFQTARTASTTYVKTAYRPRLRVYVEKVKVTLKRP